MKDITMPIPDIANGDLAEIELRIGGKTTFHFRLESFTWESEEDASIIDESKLSDIRASRLRKAIDNYDKSWELIQIYPPGKGSKTVKILYRKRI